MIAALRTRGDLAQDLSRQLLLQRGALRGRYRSDPTDISTQLLDLIAQSFWPAILAPSAFRLLTGQSELTLYQFNTRQHEHHFCRHCGVRAFGIGNAKSDSRIYGVNLGCLEDATPEELAAAPIVYIDGRHDQWTRPPAITPYL